MHLSTRCLLRGRLLGRRQCTTCAYQPQRAKALRRRELPLIASRRIDRLCGTWPTRTMHWRLISHRAPFFRRSIDYPTPLVAAALATVMDGAVGRDELPFVSVRPQRQLEHTVPGIVPDLASRHDRREPPQARTARTDDK